MLTVNFDNHDDVNIKMLNEITKHIKDYLDVIMNENAFRLERNCSQSFKEWKRMFEDCRDELNGSKAKLQTAIFEFNLQIQNINGSKQYIENLSMSKPNKSTIGTGILGLPTTKVEEPNINITEIGLYFHKEGANQIRNFAIELYTSFSNYNINVSKIRDLLTLRHYNDTPLDSLRQIFQKNNLAKRTMIAISSYEEDFHFISLPTQLNSLISIK